MVRRNYSCSVRWPVVASSARRMLGRDRPRLAIDVVDVVETVEPADRHRLERLFNGRSNVEKADPPVNKGAHRGLVGGMEHSGAATALYQCLTRQTQRQEALGI